MMVSFVSPFLTNPEFGQLGALRSSFFRLTPQFSKLPNKRSATSNQKGASRVTIQASLNKKKKNSWGFAPPDIPTIQEQYEIARAELKYGPARYDDRITVDPAKLRNNLLRSQEYYLKLRLQIVGDTLFLASLGVSICIAFTGLKETASYCLGVGGSLIYLLLLARSVDQLAEVAKQGAQAKGDSLGPARQLVFAAIVLVVAKNQQYLGIIPMLAGFLTYKLALLLPFLTNREIEEPVFDQDYDDY